MKILAIMFLTIFLSKGCDEETTKDAKSAVIEYTANTRGFYQKITVRDQTLTISTDRNETKQATAVRINDADWKLVMEAFQEINLEGMPNLKAPTEKRFYDGAAMADLKITFKGKIYQSQTFDHKHPPAGIAKLVDKLVSFVKE